MNATRSKPGRRPPGAAIQSGESAPSAAIWAEPRNLFLFRTGRLFCANGEEKCEIVALAESGAILRSASTHVQGDMCTLELNSSHLLGGFIAWSDGNMAGLEFDDIRDVRAVLAGRDPRFPYRAPRLGLDCQLEISLGSRRLKTRCHDISEAGINVELPADDCAGAEAVVALDELGSIPGRVQWWRAGRAGISFERPIAAGPFTQWMKARLEAQAG